MTKQRGLLKARALAAVGFFFFFEGKQIIKKRDHVDLLAAEQHIGEIYTRDV